MSDAALLMDKMYRRQRHIYDLSRKYYLIGRDEAISRLRPASGELVLEIGCGTGRNLVKAARTYPRAKFFGIDVSREMLDTAAASIARARLSSRITIARADATAFDPMLLFGAGAVRARDDFLRLVDNPALARGARQRPRRRRGGRFAPCHRFRRLRRLAKAARGGLARLACRIRRDAARGSRRDPIRPLFRPRARLDRGALAGRLRNPRHGELRGGRITRDCSCRLRSHARKSALTPLAGALAGRRLG